ncbi:MAG: DUF4981 domain-containing protein, partial [Bacteroidetes bacterium]|nr:DUF4981 domain-containing protein [Bacteroidota bacterium]
EVQKVQQYIKVKAYDLARGEITIENNYSFVSLANFAGDWTLTADGVSIDSGRLDMSAVGPGKSARIRLPISDRIRNPGLEYFLNIRCRLRKKTLWADAGFVVAREQLAVGTGSGVPTGKGVSAGEGGTGSGVSWIKDGDGWRAEASGVIVRVDGKTGLVVSFSGHGKEYLVSPVRPNFWRAPLDNDIGWKTPVSMGAWKEAGAKARLDSCRVAGDQLVAEFTLPVNDAGLRLTYQLLPDGRCRIDMLLHLGEKSPELPRIGLQWAIPSNYGRIKWWGRGPQENYLDRKTAAFVGLYQSTVDEWVTPYVRPQENANRCDVRWIEFGSRDGSGLGVQADGRTLGVSAWPYSQADLETVTHNYQLPHREFITVNADGWQMGVGGDISWGLPVHDQYRLLAKGNYEYGIFLESLQ